jgi:hypothetical protein
MTPWLGHRDSGHRGQHDASRLSTSLTATHQYRNRPHLPRSDTTSSVVSRRSRPAARGRGSAAWSSRRAAAAYVPMTNRPSVTSAADREQGRPRVGMRELSQRTAKVMALVRAGETVEVTDRDKIVALNADQVLGDATTVPPERLRTLDAIHLARVGPRRLRGRPSHLRQAPHPGRPRHRPHGGVPGRVVMILDMGRYTLSL